MARVKQTKMRLELDPASPWKETVVFVNYDNRKANGYRDVPEERFYVTLPQVVADALGITETRGTTQEEAEKRFLEAIERFKVLKTEVNRVILYRFDIEPLPDDHPKYNRYTGTGYLQVRVWFDTYKEIVAIAGDGVKRYSYEKVESELGCKSDYAGPSRHEGKRYDCQVPWTEQNEAFFKWIKERMTELIERMAELYFPDKLIDMINAGRLLPLCAGVDGQK